MKQRKSIILQTLRMAAILTLILSCQSPLVACQNSRRPSRYLLPDGYVGWVTVYFNVKDAAPVEFEDGRYLFSFSSTGKLETSSDNEYGVGPVDEFFYYSGKLRRQLQIARSDGSGMIWNVHNGQRLDSQNRVIETYEGFFVGTEQDYREYGCHKDENGQPSTGPIDKSKLKKCSTNETLEITKHRVISKQVRLSRQFLIGVRQQLDETATEDGRNCVAEAKPAWHKETGVSPAILM